MPNFVCYRSLTSAQKRKETGNPDRIMRKPGFDLVLFPTEKGIKIDYKVLMMEKLLMAEGSKEVEPEVGVLYSVDYSLSTKDAFVRESSFGSISEVSNAPKINIAAILKLSDGTVLVKISNMISISCNSNEFGCAEEKIVEAGTRPFTCFSSYNEDAAELMRASQAKKSALVDINFLDSLSYLEAQVDILTKVVLAGGLADKDELKEVLVRADDEGIWRSNSKEKLLKKMDKKRKFRELQLTYYEANKK